MKSEQQDRYGWDDPELVSVIDDLPFWSGPFGMRLLDAVRYRPGIRALDIGFGLGFPLVELAMRLGASARVSGIDPWKAGHERTLRKLRIAGVRNVELVEGEAESMPFKNDTFDLIVSNNGINNVRDIRRTFAECSRVSRMNAQFVLTYNTAGTFVEFYDAFRSACRESGMADADRVIDDHIAHKRPPVEMMRRALEDAGFRINALREDSFRYRFSNGSAMLGYFPIRLAFLPAWESLLPEHLRVEIFRRTEEQLNHQSDPANGFSTTVPFATIDCEKIKRIS